MRVDRIFAYMYGIEMAIVRRGIAPFWVAVQLHWPFFYQKKWHEKLWYIGIFLYVPIFVGMLSYQTWEVFGASVLKHIVELSVIGGMLIVVIGMIWLVEIICKDRK